MKNKFKWKIFSFCLISFFIIMILVLRDNISWLDNGIYNFIISFKSDGMTSFLKFITFLASTKFIVSCCLISLIMVILKYKWSLYLICNVIISAILNNIIKYLVCRARPVGIALISETGYSFPSGHTMASVSFYGFIIFLIINSKKIDSKYKWIISTILTLLILLVGVSRIYLGVHYPSDVIGGYLISISLLILNSYIIKKYRKDDLK